ncbi:hypothetical protein AX17_007458 [Amanita inopinata Kibby_2008]|nr:hypothetical protein AX17_007458 [Amanita inopinata Kibby_2008]
MLKSPPLRTKRNFKSLQLPELLPIVTLDVAGDPMPTRLAPVPSEKRRPPPLLEEECANYSASSAYSGITPGTGRSRSAMQASLTNTLASLDIKGSTKFDLRNEDLKNLEELGHGNGGSVVKVKHMPSGTIMAEKIVLIDSKPSVRKRILRELQIIHECNSPYIVSSYGAYLKEPNICICMEYMDKGSFDGIYKKIGAIDIAVVNKVAQSVLEGLTYLYDVHRIIHRDIKPSNILCNSQGEFKLCDFGVSGELINSIAHTFVGTSVYMSPERIQGAEYSVKSDVWSLGITLIELANGRFPFSGSSFDDGDDDVLSASQEGFNVSNDKTPSREDSVFSAKTVCAARRRSKRQSTGVSLHGEGMTMSILELMHQIVNEPAPRLGSEGRFPKEADEFVHACLLKNPEERKTPKLLLVGVLLPLFSSGANVSDMDDCEQALINHNLFAVPVMLIHPLSRRVINPSLGLPIPTSDLPSITLPLGNGGGGGTTAPAKTTTHPGGSPPATTTPIYHSPLPGNNGAQTGPSQPNPTKPNIFSPTVVPNPVSPQSPSSPGGGSPRQSQGSPLSSQGGQVISGIPSSGLPSGSYSHPYALPASDNPLSPVPTEYLGGYYTTSTMYSEVVTTVNGHVSTYTTAIPTVLSVPPQTGHSSRTRIIAGTTTAASILLLLALFGLFVWRRKLLRKSLIELAQKRKKNEGRTLLDDEYFDDDISRLKRDFVLNGSNTTAMPGSRERAMVESRVYCSSGDTMSSVEFASQTVATSDVSNSVTIAGPSPSPTGPADAVSPFGDEERERTPTQSNPLRMSAISASSQDSFWTPEPADSESYYSQESRGVRVRGTDADTGAGAGTSVVEGGGVMPLSRWYSSSAVSVPITTPRSGSPTSHDSHSETQQGRQPDGHPFSHGYVM